jgi:hypothetical protein
LLTIKAIYDKENRYNKFQAILQGVDIDENAEANEDITELDGWRATEAGFGIGMGLGHEIQGG